jgi:RNA polymerase sigma-70 factor, ECF subfamily
MQRSGDSSSEPQVEFSRPRGAVAIAELLASHVRAGNTITLSSGVMRSSQNRAMSEASQREVRVALDPYLARLWRYALVLSAACDAAEQLVQATCRQAIERADQFAPGTRIDRSLFAILRSIWVNESRAPKVRKGGGAADALGALSIGGAQANTVTADVLKVIGRLPEEQREAVLLVYGEGYRYAEAASALGIPTNVLMGRLAAARSALAKVK